MLNIDKNLSQIFDISNVIDVEPIEPIEDSVLPPIVQPTIESNVDTDFIEARSNIRSLMATGEDALEALVDIAKESEQPRAFEIVAMMMRQLSDMNHQLVDLHEKKKKLSHKSDTNASSNTVTNNTVFIGTTASLNKMIEDQLLKQQES